MTDYRAVVAKMLAYLEAESKHPKHVFEVSRKFVARAHLAQLERLIQTEISESAAEQAGGALLTGLLTKPYEPKEGND